jgi:ribosomal protein S18 acetylase RimI-like enzyme
MISIRRPAAGEAAAMAAMHVQSWRESYEGYLPQVLFESLAAEKRTAIWARQIDNEDRILLTAYDGEAPVAFINAGPVSEGGSPVADGEIAALYVLQRLKRQGLGRRLVALASAAWTERGGKALQLGVLAANRPARDFYESLGARHVRDDSYNWDGHGLPVAIYVFNDLGALA